jgi:competence protein ComEA
MKFLTLLLLSITFLFSSVDINNATEKELTALKGVGVKKAQTIVEYRNTIKCFKSIEQLSQVKGIGEATLAKNKENLSLGKCKKK